MKEMGIETFKIPLPIYTYRKIKIIIYRQKYKNKDLKKIHKKYSIDFDTSYKALSYYHNGKHYIILPDDVTPGLLSHEIFHLSNDILKYVGVKADYDNDEAQAYLIDYLMDKVWKKLK